MSFLNEKVLPKLGDFLLWADAHLYVHWRAYVAVVVTVVVMKGCG